jgi:hypothetical protein
VFIWFFGYIGNTFFPQAELNISQQSMVAAAKNLSAALGRNNLVLVTAVDEIPLPTGFINKSMIPTIRSYVAQLKQYASAVYGRLDFYQFNLTATAFGSCTPWYNCPFYNQSRMYVNQLGLDGIWYDHPSQYYNNVSGTKFNQMMQNLTQLFPKTKFLLNQTPGSKIGYAAELPGYSWLNQTSACPSPSLGSLTVNQKQEETVYNIFAGHIILHLDAEGPPAIGTNPHEPMSIFASENVSQEASALRALLYNGTHLPSANQTYSFVVPLVGSWTFNGTIKGSPDYMGTLYNGLTVGNYARSTISIFEQVIKSVNPIASLSPSKSPVGKTVTVTGNHFRNSSKINLRFDGSPIANTTSNATGSFTIAFNVPASSAGLHNVSISESTNVINLGLTTSSKITEKPTNGPSGGNVTVAGTGFSANNQVKVTFNGSLVATAETNSNGSFSTSYIVPYLLPGSYTVQAIDSFKNNPTVSFKITL